ncbi:type II toxin-antitoxin system VapC family toxin [Sphingomonas sp. ac-8]|uniref:type II toxin-antitoxin system VapC family toxin n=1 Tax=Sphingomonas sp. ac-8 TaxID=3242977 RepID=UPI003A7FBF36
MTYLLDTHALIWWWLGDPKLSAPARAAIGARGNRVAVSAVSAFEIALKVRSGQLPAMLEPLQQFEGAVIADGMIHLPLRQDHCRTAGLMAGDHRDPFDRMIAAQGLVDGLTVITRDPQFAAFGCETLW